MSEKKNSLNAYVCTKLHGTITKHLHDGTTPMFISCPQCGEQATSRMGRVDESLVPTFEWFKPSMEEVDVEANRLQTEFKIPYKSGLSGVMDHVKRGGLIMRKISS